MINDVSRVVPMINRKHGQRFGLYRVVPMIKPKKLRDRVRVQSYFFYSPSMMSRKPAKPLYMQRTTISSL